MTRSGIGPPRAARPAAASRGSGPARPASAARWLPWMLLLLAAIIRIGWPHPLARTPDETFFTQYARSVAREGPGVIARFVDQCADHPERGVFPWPQRAGYVQLSAAVLVVAGSDSVWLLVALSTVASLGVIALVAALLLRFADPWTAAIAVLFLAVSPLDLEMARRVWQDDVLALFTTGMLGALALATVRPGDPRPRFLAFALAAVAMTIKETALPVAAGATAYLMWRAWREGSGVRGVLAMAAGGCAALAVAALAITVAAGGPEAVRRTIELARIVNVPNEYMRTFQSGSPLYYAEGLARLQPAPALLAVIGVVAWIARRWPGAVESRATLAPLVTPATWMLVAFAAVASLYPQKNLRFLAPLFAPGAIVAAAFVRATGRALSARAAPPVVRWIAPALAVVLLALAAADLARYHHWFVVRGVPDLATPWFRR